MTAKMMTPFVWTPRMSQMKRTLAYMRNLSQDPALRPFLILELTDAEPIDAVRAVTFTGAVGSYNFDGSCSHCRKPIRLWTWRVEVVIARQDVAPIAFQFGERFCCQGCAITFATAFKKYGLAFQSIDREPEKIFLVLERNGKQNFLLN